MPWLPIYADDDGGGSARVLFILAQNSQAHALAEAELARPKDVRRIEAVREMGMSRWLVALDRSVHAPRATP